jgi:methylmalonyl-CoA/ethylmalonyl-CoA epimerase
MPLASARVAQIAINAHKLDRAVEFYRDTLGLPLLFTAPGMAFFDCAGVRLMVGLPTSGEFDHPSSIVYFHVPDLDAAHAALVARGVTIVRPPFLAAPMPDHDLWMTFFRDTERNTLALMAEKPKP